MLLDANVMISELLANNSQDSLDFDDNDSDWLEVLNRGPSSVDLDGWCLCNNSQNLTQWQFPVSSVLAPDERLVERGMACILRLQAVKRETVVPLADWDNIDDSFQPRRENENADAFQL